MKLKNGVQLAPAIPYDRYEICGLAHHTHFFYAYLIYLAQRTFSKPILDRSLRKKSDYSTRRKRERGHSSMLDLSNMGFAHPGKDSMFTSR